MDQLQFAALTPYQPRHESEALSALPDAPQVAEGVKPQPVRAVTAKVLIRLADRLAPTPSPAC